MSVIVSNKCSLQYFASINGTLGERLVVKLGLFTADPRWLRLTIWRPTFVADVSMAVMHVVCSTFYLVHEVQLLVVFALKFYSFFIEAGASLVARRINATLSSLALRCRWLRHRVRFLLPLLDLVVAHAWNSVSSVIQI